ncbi:MAG: hypothetical protein HY519_03470 [Candidatus Aenigmarchaeota archaeon]|nr:hypothetical protein [Candidatus Aenigmarchaeota archaeon]
MPYTNESIAKADATIELLELLGHYIDDKQQRKSAERQRRLGLEVQAATAAPEQPAPKVPRKLEKRTWEWWRPVLRPDQMVLCAWAGMTVRTA